jgi:hypothetical protein
MSAYRLERRKMGWLVNWKGFGRKQLWPKRDTISAFALEGLRKSTKRRNQDSRCRCLDSNPAPPMYEYRALPLHQSAGFAQFVLIVLHRWLHLFLHKRTICGGLLTLKNVPNFVASLKCRSTKQGCHMSWSCKILRGDMLRNTARVKATSTPSNQLRPEGFHFLWDS